MEIWTAFIIGFVGSVHCVGMCGPIVIVLPGKGYKSPISYLWSRILYNLGRVVTYSLMGAVAGFIGQSISLGGYQQKLSIILGVLILLGVFLPTKFAASLLPLPSFDPLKAKVKQLWLRHFNNPSFRSLFTIGILNGFLPCGFVYLGLAGALSTGGVLKGIAYMALFGLGTVPILVATSYAGKILGLPIRRAINRLIPVGAVIIALLFILRGLDLGIPYISPESKMLQTGTHQDKMLMKTNQKN